MAAAAEKKIDVFQTERWESIEKARALVAAKFPAIEFSIFGRDHTNHVDVRWIDGPTTERVRRDLRTITAAIFILRREYSPEFIREVIEMIEIRTGEEIAQMIEIVQTSPTTALAIGRGGEMIANRDADDYICDTLAYTAAETVGM